MGAAPPTSKTLKGTVLSGNTGGMKITNKSRMCRSSTTHKQDLERNCHLATQEGLLEEEWAIPNSLVPTLPWPCVLTVLKGLGLSLCRITFIACNMAARQGWYPVLKSLEAWH